MKSVRTALIITIVLAATKVYCQDDKLTGDIKVIVADAVFKPPSPYIGLVRFIQRATANTDGDYLTHVVVNLKNGTDQSLQTENHMWHVEQNPVTTAYTCDDNNPHFNPFGFSKSDTNYKVFCTASTPDQCYMGDLSSKSQLVNVGNDPQVVTARIIPLTGPNSIIGHSLNIHKENKLAERIACTDITLNTRLTTWTKIITVPVKTTSTKPFNMYRVRSALSYALKVPIEYVQTAKRLDNVNTDTCTTIDFLILGTIPPYTEKVVTEIEAGKRDLGDMSPVGCTVDGEVVEKPPEVKPPQNCEATTETATTKSPKNSGSILSLSFVFLVALCPLAFRYLV